MDAKTALAIKKRIVGSGRIVLTLHEGADLDSYGANMAMYKYLRQIGKQAVLLNGKDGGEREYWSFLPGRENLTPGVVTDFVWRGGDLFVAIDVAIETQIDSVSPPKFPLKNVTTIVIDHHYDASSRFGEINLIEKRSSAAEVVLDLVGIWGGKIDSEMADWLYMGILSDTGSFKFPIVNRLTFEAAGKLAGFGARCSYLSAKLVAESLPSIRAVALAIAQAKIVAGGKLMFCILTDERLAAVDLKLDQLGSIHKRIGYYLSIIDGLSVGIIARPKGEGRWGVSFRSNSGEKYDMGVLAADFGGGGHKQAASGSVEAGSEDELVQMVMKKVAARYPDLGGQLPIAFR